MQYAIILLCALLSCAKVTIQGNLAKGSVKNTADSALANCLIFAFVSILFSISLRNGINPEVIGYASLFGAFSASFQIFYALALKYGPFSATCMLINLSMVLPVIFSSIFFDEKLTVLKVAGILLCLLALFLNTKSDDKKPNLRWFFYVLMAFLSTGSLSIVQKIFAEANIGGSYQQFVFLGYLTAFLITSVVVLVQKGTKQEITFKLTRRNLTLAICIAMTLGVFQYLYTFANSFIDAVVLSPSVSGLSTTFQMLSGRVIFREKFTIKQICSICIGIIAIILISS